MPAYREAIFRGGTSKNYETLATEDNKNLQSGLTRNEHGLSFYFRMFTAYDVLVERRDQNANKVRKI